VRANLKRSALPALLVIVGTTVCPAPVLADTVPATPIRAAVSAFSSDALKNVKNVRTVAPAGAAKKTTRAQTSGQSFFQSKKGAVALGLMAGGAVFTVWSISHDRKPVKSPVR
jgi:hypothetical protein